ncbi:hypothetical protein D9M68_444070 [compost metagenome]
MEDDVEERPEFRIVNGYEIHEISEGAFTITGSDAPMTDTPFPSFDEACQFARQLEPGPRRR